MSLTIFTPEFLSEIGFIKDFANGEPQYGKAISIKPKGKRILYWNNEGHSCDYFGNKLNPNICLVIEEDGGTRTVFNGIVYSKEDVKNLLSLVQ